MKERISQLIDHLNLKSHPEGGFFSETYRSAGIIPAGALPNDFDGDRNYSTAIYFLLDSEHFSAFHKIHQDEVWHFYEGSSLTLHVISQSGEYQQKILGGQLEQGESLQLVIPAGAWFGATVNQADSYTLCGCTVAPGFDFADFELADQARLLRQFPQHEEIIRSLTRPD